MHQLQGNKEFGSEKRGYLLKKSDGYGCECRVCQGAGDLRSTSALLLPAAVSHFFVCVYIG